MIRWNPTKAKQIDAKFVGKGIVQIDPDLIQIANWAPGNVIEIQESKKNAHTYAIVNLSDLPEDNGTNIIRLNLINGRMPKFVSMIRFKYGGLPKMLAL